MKKLFSLVTLSFLASSSMVEAKFNVDPILNDNNPGRVVTRGLHRDSVLSLAKDFINTKTPAGKRNKELIKSEASALKILIASKLQNKPKSVVDKNKAIYLQAVATRKKAVQKFNPNTATQESFLMRWAHVITKDTLEGKSDYAAHAHSAFSASLLNKMFLLNTQPNPNEIPSLSKMKAAYLQARKEKAARKVDLAKVLKMIKNNDQRNPNRAAQAKKAADVKAALLKAAQAKKIADAKAALAKAAQLRAVQAKRIAAPNAAQLKAIHAKKIADAKAAQLKAAQAKKVADAKAAQLRAVHIKKAAEVLAAAQIRAAQLREIQAKKAAPAKQAPKAVAKPAPKAVAKPVAIQNQELAKKNALMKQAAAQRKAQAQPAEALRQAAAKAHAEARRKALAEQLAGQRQLAAKQLAAKQLAAKQLAAKQLAAKQLAAKQLAAKQLAAKQLAAKQLAAKRQVAANKNLEAIPFQNLNGIKQRVKNPGKENWEGEFHCTNGIIVNRIPGIIIVNGTIRKEPVIILPNGRNPVILSSTMSNPEYSNQ